MVSLAEAVTSNKRLATTYPNGFVAVFVGGTSGVGEYTVLKVAQYIPKARVYLVGRSQERADRIIAACKQLCPSGSFTFIAGDISVVKGVDAVCERIRSQETAIDVLFQSQGSMGFDEKTADGLPLTTVLFLHSRVRFMLNFLPLLQRGRLLRRVVSVASGTKEGAVDRSSAEAIYGNNLALPQSRAQTASQITLSLQKVAELAPTVAFVHALPGIVKSNIGRDATRISLRVMNALVSLMGSMVWTPSDEVGEMHLFYATSARYPPGDLSGNARTHAERAGVPVEKPVAISRGVDGNLGSGVYSIDTRGEPSSATEHWMAQFHQDGTAERTWELVTGDLERAAAT